MKKEITFPQSFLVRRVDRHTAGLKPIKGRMNLLIGSMIIYNGGVDQDHNYLFSQCCVDPTSLGGGLPTLKSSARAERYPNGINDHVSMTKMRFQLGGHQLLLDLESDGLRQVYFSQTCYTGMNTSLALNPDMRRTGQVLKYAKILQLHPITEIR